MTYYLQLVNEVCTSTPKVDLEGLLSITLSNANLNLDLNYTQRLGSLEWKELVPFFKRITEGLGPSEQRNL